MNITVEYISCCEIPVWRDVWLGQSIGSKNYDLPKVNKSGKTVKFNFPEVSKMTINNFPKCLKMTSDFFYFHGFRKTERERDRESLFLTRNFAYL